jgi:hypothetical protein
MSFDLEHVQSLARASLSTMAALVGGAPAGGAAAFSQFHITSAGDTLVTSGRTAANTGDLVLTGAIGSIPYELHLHFDLNPATAQIAVTLEMKKPIQAGPYTWIFGLDGVVRDGTNNIIAANDVKVLSHLMQPLGLNWWCVAKCGGLSILGILLKCLPSLAGGVPGYVTCVTASAGAGAAGIAVCIAQNCA